MAVYHGTPEADAVLQQGLLADKAEGNCPHVWLTNDPLIAARFGEVIEVDDTGFGAWPEGAWQVCYHGGDIPPERLRKAKV